MACTPSPSREDREPRLGGPALDVIGPDKSLCKRQTNKRRNTNLFSLCWLPQTVDDTAKASPRENVFGLEAERDTRGYAGVD